MPLRTRVKICGITRLEDARAAVAAGADAIGLVFEPNSPRCVDVASAHDIVIALPPFVSVVGLFVDTSPEQVRQVLSSVRLDLLQFHGRETPDQCRSIGRPYIKAIRMRDGVDPRASAAQYGDAVGLLLDTYVDGVAGGSGQAFDWSRVPHGVGKPLILAGGLTPANVGRAITTARPYAVDVSSGVERTKRTKDAEKIQAFIAAVREADRHSADGRSNES